MRRTAGLAVLAATLAGATAAHADERSLYRGPSPRPGPDILYAGPVVAPQLTNAGVWRADPILVSGARSYRDGEFVYQDYLYDDHGARLARDPSDPRSGDDTFSGSNGTYTYPSDRVYADNAADLVELRVKPLADATAFRLTLNTLKDPEKVAATIAIGSSAAPLPFPHGANATAPAAMFLTVHGRSADLLDATTKQPVAGGAPAVSVDLERRQIELRVPHGAWNPGRQVVRLAAGVGLWNAAAGSYLAPQGPARTATTPGGGAPGATAFFNAAFRFDEPLPSVASPEVLSNPAWWRDKAQGSALQTGDMSPFHADVDFGKLADGARDDAGVPRTGVLNRILASRFEPEQGVDFNRECGSSEGCAGELLGRLQPYALYVPREGAGRWPLRAAAAAALARGQLQPVLGQPQPVAVRRPRPRAPRDHARGARPGRLVLRPRGRGHVRGLGRRRAPLRARSGGDVDRRLLDGRLRHVQVRDPVPGPVRQGPADRRAARARRVGRRRTRRSPAASARTRSASSRRCGTSRS